MVDLETGKVVEFHSDEIEVLQQKIAAEHGFEIVDHTRLGVVRAQKALTQRRSARCTRPLMQATLTDPGRAAASTSQAASAFRRGHVVACPSASAHALIAAPTAGWLVDANSSAMQVQCVAAGRSSAVAARSAASAASRHAAATRQCSDRGPPLGQGVVAQASPQRLLRAARRQ